MKNILVILSLLLIAFASCKKCGTCYYTRTVTPTTPQAGYPEVTEYSVDACGDDYKEMRKFDEDKTYDVSTSTGAPAKMVVHQTDCDKK